MAILETKGLEKRFGGIVATHDVSLSIEKGARHALIGPNGAGKTTIINLLTGVLKPTAGTITLDGRDITALEPHRRVRLGMARTFQINQLFLDLTPLEHIGLAVSERLGSGADWWRLVGSKSSSAFVLPTSCTCAPRFCPTASSDSLRSRWLSPAVRTCCCSMSPPPACRRRSGMTFLRPSPRCQTKLQSCSSSTTWIWCSHLP